MDEGGVLREVFWERKKKCFFERVFFAVFFFLVLETFGSALHLEHQPVVELRAREQNFVSGLGFSPKVVFYQVFLGFI